MGIERDEAPMNRLPMCFAAALAALICHPPAAVAQNSAVEKIYADLATLPASQRDKRIEDGARAEGKLVIIHTMRGNLSTDHLDLFHRRYPFLRIELEGDIGSQDATERLYTEETAGRHLTDVINVALPDLTALRDKDMLARFSSSATAASPRWQGPRCRFVAGVGRPGRGLLSLPPCSGGRCRTRGPTSAPRSEA